MGGGGGGRGVGGLDKWHRLTHLLMMCRSAHLAAASSSRPRATMNLCTDSVLIVLGTTAFTLHAIYMQSISATSHVSQQYSCHIQPRPLPVSST